MCATLGAVPLPRFQPMLASSGPIAGDAAAWSFEPKLDGWRVLVYVNGDRVTVRSRNGRDITDSVPELGALADVVDRPVVLDGELVAHEGRPSDFYRLGPRLWARGEHRWRSWPSTCCSTART